MKLWKDMDEKERRIGVALAIGWTMSDCGFFHPPENPACQCRFNHLPDFNDQNVMHELENRLGPYDMHYGTVLERICKWDGDEVRKNPRWTWNATAEMRAEAFYEIASHYMQRGQWELKK